MTNTFHKDLAWGLQIEEKALALIKPKYPKAYIAEALKEYDIFIPEKNYSIEVKCDMKSNHTGNILIEVEMFGKPSGLTATTATYWLFYDDKQWAWIKPMEIVRCIFLNKYPLKEFTSKGDTEPKKAFLVDKKILYNFATHIQNVAMRQPTDENGAVQ